MCVGILNVILPTPTHLSTLPLRQPPFLAHPPTYSPPISLLSPPSHFEPSYNSLPTYHPPTHSPKPLPIPILVSKTPPSLVIHLMYFKDYNEQLRHLSRTEQLYTCTCIAGISLVLVIVCNTEDSVHTQNKKTSVI